MFRFLHAADLHLDSPLKGLQAYPGAPVDKLKLATRDALENLVELAIADNVDFVLIAGDIYDGDWPDYKTGQFFGQQMSKLNRASIPVFLIAGNHDAQNKMTKELPLPENVRRFSHKKPETHLIEKLAVAIHGQSFAKAAVEENLALAYPPAAAGCFNIGVLHTNLGGNADHDNYAPCKLDDLLAKDYDYWALGHIHQREIIRENGPVVAYSGNIQGRHIRETGPKGCLLVTVDGGNRTTTEFRELDVLRWAKCEIDVSGVEAAESAVEMAIDWLAAEVEKADERLIAARVEFHGASPVHRQFMSRMEHWVESIRARAVDALAERVWIEKVKFRTTAPREAAALVEADGPLGELSRVVAGLISGDELPPEYSKELADLKQKLGDAFAGDDGSLEFGSAAWVREQLAVIEPLLSARLLADGAAE